MEKENEEEEDNGFALDERELNVFYEVLFTRIMDIMEDPNININPFEDMIKILSRLSEIFSFKSMITVIPELVAYAIKYGMNVEKAYDEDLTNLKEDKQGYGEAEEKERKRSVIQKDLDKLNMYL
ncbi:MAG: hypothetical protein ACTSO8_04655 [Promethearchaeota archaeon]